MLSRSALIVGASTISGIYIHFVCVSLKLHPTTNPTKARELASLRERLLFFLEALTESWPGVSLLISAFPFNQLLKIKSFLDYD